MSQGWHLQEQGWREWFPPSRCLEKQTPWLSLCAFEKWGLCPSLSPDKTHEVYFDKSLTICGKYLELFSVRMVLISK